MILRARTTTFLLPILLLCGDEMSMELVKPPKNLHPTLLVGAPHEGWDLKTESIGKDVADRLGADAAIARNYRKPKLGRFFNVNRPTESDLDNPTDPSSEHVTDAAQAVFADWITLIRRGKSGRIGLYVQIHGFSDSVDVNGTPVPLEVVELATVAIARADAQQLQAAWTAQAAKLGLPPLYVDQLDPTYTFAGQTVTFRRKATRAKQIGDLQPTYVDRALHFELPHGLRFDATQRANAARLIAELLQPLLGPANTR